MLAVALSAAGDASALTTEHAQAVGQWSYRNAPFSQSTCASTCAELLDRQFALPSYSRTASELAQLEQKAGLWERAAPVLGRVSLAATAAIIGWKIGNGIRSLWVATPTPTTTEAPDFSSASFYGQGATIASLWGVNVLAPSAGWALETDGGVPYFYTLKAQSPCPLSISPPTTPPDGEMLTVDMPQPAGENCYVQPWGPWKSNTPAQQAVMFVPMKLSMPVDFDAQPYASTVLPGSDPGVDGATNAVKTELETHANLYPRLLPWLETSLDDIDYAHADTDYQQNDGTDDAVDPKRDTYPYVAPPDTDWRRWCETSAPGTGVSEIDSGPGWFESYPSPSSFPANGIGTADLLYGTDAETGFGNWNDIKGFGVRKIAAKHGWATSDVLATSAALLTDPVRGPYGKGDRYEFHGAPYQPTSSAVPAEYLSQGHCERVVVVATTTAAGEPRSRGIVTSFGKWIGPKP